jgi:hypothetical protein
MNTELRCARAGGAIIGSVALAVCAQAQVMPVSQMRFVEASASGTGSPGGPPGGSEQHQVDSPDFETFTASVSAVGGGADGAGSGRASQTTSVLTPMIGGDGAAHAEAVAHILSGPGAGEGHSSFAYVFSVGAASRYEATAALRVVGPQNPPQNCFFVVQSATFGFGPVDGTPLAGGAASLTSRVVDVSGAGVVPAGQYSVTADASSSLISCTAWLPLEIADTTFQFSLTISPAPTCLGDFNVDGVVNSDDFFDYLARFFASHPFADVDGDGVVTSADFFLFLTSFFAGC